MSGGERRAPPCFCTGSRTPVCPHRLGLERDVCVQVLGTPRHSGPLGCLKYSITVAVSTAWGVCVCVCVCVCVSVRVCAQLQEFRLRQPVPLIFLGQQSWCWKPDPALSAFLLLSQENSHLIGMAPVPFFQPGQTMV